MAGGERHPRGARLLGVASTSPLESAKYGEYAAGKSRRSYWTVISSLPDPLNHLLDITLQTIILRRVLRKSGECTLVGGEGASAGFSRPMLASPRSLNKSGLLAYLGSSTSGVSFHTTTSY